MIRLITSKKLKRYEDCIASMGIRIAKLQREKEIAQDFASDFLALLRKQKIAFHELMRNLGEQGYLKIKNPVKEVRIEF